MTHLSPALLEALNTLLSFHTHVSMGGKLEVNWELQISDADLDNRRRYADAWRVVSDAVSPT